jgi:glycerophosphoryl diester phosphodiesterase
MMSHRGGSLEYVENTLPAFIYSSKVLKVEMLELDVHMTKDKQITIFHDTYLGRMCGYCL